MKPPPTIAIIAGETSGDQLGGWLMEAISAQSESARFIGLGGPMMEAQGLTPLFPMSDISLMGFAEILPHVRRLKRRIAEMIDYIERENPDVVVSIDSPGFCVRVVKALRARGKVKPKFIHYVAPTVWAYKPKRVHKMKANFDALLVLLPFEPPYFTAVGLETHFIGHEIAWWWKDHGDGAAFRDRHGIGEAPLLAVFPGSRKREIADIWPAIKGAVEQLSTTIPNLRTIIQVPPYLVSRMNAEAASWQVPALVLSSTAEKKDLFAAATVGIAKSGTIGLECALAGLPSIIAFRGPALTIAVLRKVVKVKYINLANLLAAKPIIPELIQQDCEPATIAKTVLPLLIDKDAQDMQRRELKDVARQLGAFEVESPSTKAARIILAALDRA